MANNDQTIVGGRALDEFLQQLPVKVERNILRSALRAGANVIKDTAKANVPVKTGALRKSLQVTTGSKGSTVTARLKARGKVAPHAVLVEFGAKPHKIKLRRAGGLTVGGHVVAEVDHPGSRPKPFLRPAFDGQSGAAISAVGAKIRDRLTAEGINSPAPEIE